jgi:carboxymethylenebutenolidase
MSAYFSQPETTGKVPGVIVIMEAFGVNKHIQEVTDNLFKEGFVAVAPVLYHRLGSNPLFSYTGEDADVCTRAMGRLRDTELTRDLNTTIAYPKGYAQVQADRLGDERPSYHAEAAKDAWGRTLSWFQTYLKAYGVLHCQ